MRSRTTSLRVFLGLLAGSMACSEDLAPPDPAPVVWTGRRVEIATHGEVLECGGSRAYLDAFAELVIADLELDVGPAQRARIYLLEPDELDELGFCPPDARCVYAERAYTDVAVDKHELVHALRGLEYGDALPGPIFFEEGIATLYGDDVLRVPEQRDVLMGIESGTEGIRGVTTLWWYGLAADFIAFIGREVGVAEFSRFLGDLDDAGDLQAVGSRFEDRFSESLEAAVVRYDDTAPRCTPFARTRHLVECAQDPVSVPAQVSFDLTCENDAVIGPMDGSMWRSFTFEVEDEEILLLRSPLQGEEPIQQPRCSGFTMQVTDCERSCLAEIDIAEPREGDDRVEEAMTFLPGRYVVRLGRPVDDPGEACVEIGPLIPE